MEREICVLHLSSQRDCPDGAKAAAKTGVRVPLRRTNTATIDEPTRDQLSQASRTAADEHACDHVLPHKTSKPWHGIKRRRDDIVEGACPGEVCDVPHMSGIKGLVASRFICDNLVARSPDGYRFSVGTFGVATGSSAG